MKKFIITLVVTTVTIFTMQAQEGLGLSLKAGLNINQGTMLVSSQDIKTEGLVGFHAGVAYEIGMLKYFAIEPGVLLDTRGFKIEGADRKIDIIGLTIPVLAKGKFAVSDKLLVFASVGPYANIGLSGKSRKKGVDYDVEFGSSNPSQMKRVNYGINFGAGIEINRFIIGAGYDLRLSNLGNSNVVSGGIINVNIDNQIHVDAFKLSIGYKF